MTAHPNAEHVRRLTAGQPAAFLNQLKVNVGRFQPDLKRMVEQEGKQDKPWKRTKAMAAVGGVELHEERRVECVSPFPASLACLPAGVRGGGSCAAPPCQDNEHT